MNAPELAWFWCQHNATLFVGYSGHAYAQARQIEPAPVMSANAACEVFTRQINPWAAQLIPAGKTPTLYFKTIFEPPTKN